MGNKWELNGSWYIKNTIKIHVRYHIFYGIGD